MRRDIGRDDLLQSLDVGIILAVGVVFLGVFQFLADISGQVFVFHFHTARQRILESEAGGEDFLTHHILVLVQRIGDERDINASELVDGDDNAVLRVLRGRDTLGTEDTTGEDAGFLDLDLDLAVDGFLLPVILDRRDGREVHIVAEEGNSGVPVQPGIASRKIVVGPVQLVKERL